MPPKPKKRSVEARAERIKSMVFTSFQDMLEDFYDEGAGPDEIRESADFFFKQSKKMWSNPKGLAQDMMREKKHLTTRPTYGKMYMYHYDAKWKDKLPYWDRCPLIFAIEPQPKGFLGINLHYLPPTYRLSLLKALYDLEMTGRYDHRSKLALSYNILQSTRKLKAFKPCLKSYLRDHVVSPFVQIDYPYWPAAIALPLQDFQKASVNKVWYDSRQKI